MPQIEAGLGETVIADVMLPDGNGFDVLEKIKQTRPALPVIIISAQNTILTAVEASNRGAYDYLPKPFDISDLLGAVAGAVTRYNQSEQTEDKHDDPATGLPLIGRSPPMQDVYRTIARVMRTNLTVMIFGESGTGKELVARALHDLGPRRTSPFVALNMAAIPRELIESELFGYEKGAFTGAVKRQSGKFEQAQYGTLFLDEIGDMPMDAQTRLLRVLQEGEYYSLGSSRPVKIDVRIIAATHKNLNDLMAKSQFREDLFYRLNVVPIEVPPLRVRNEDIVDLAQHFLSECAGEGLPSKSLTPDAVQWLLEYSWPGNVRQLENLMQRVVALCREDLISASALSRMAANERGLSPSVTAVADHDDKPAQEVEVSSFKGGLSQAIEAHLIRYFATFDDDEQPPDGLYDHVLHEMERPLLKLALEKTGGNQIKAAKLLGINRNTLRKKLTMLKIEI